MHVPKILLEEPPRLSRNLELPVEFRDHSHVHVDPWAVGRS